MKVSKRRKRDVERGAFPEVAVTEDVAQTTLDGALKAFLLAQDASGHSKATVGDYMRTLRLLLRHMAEQHGYTRIRQVTEADIIAWLAHLRNEPNRWGKPYSSRSIGTYSRNAFTFFNWLTQHGYLEINPMTRVELPKVDKPLIRVFTDEDLKKLDAACGRDPHGRSLTPDERKALAARDRAVLWLLLSTGIRASELCSLCFRDIDWDNSMLYIQGKGAKERKVPFGKVARQHLITYLQYWRGVPEDPDHDRVFLNAFGNPLRPAAVQAMFARLKTVAGITDKRVSAHTCRHWFAVNCIKRGMPSTVLQGLLGHEDLAMINTYVHLAEQDHRELYTRFSPVDTLEMHQHPKESKRERLRAWRQMRKRPRGQSGIGASVDLSEEGASNGGF